MIPVENILPAVTTPSVVIPETLNCVTDAIPPMTDVDTPAVVA